MNPSTTALVLIEFQNDFTSEGGTLHGAYEKGFEVYTLIDALGATSLAEHENAIKFDYPMFSKPISTDDFVASLAGAGVGVADTSRGY